MSQHKTLMISLFILSLIYLFNYWWRDKSKKSLDGFLYSQGVLISVFCVALSVLLIGLRSQFSNQPIGLQIFLWPAMTLAIAFAIYKKGLPNFPDYLKSENQLGWVRICVGLSLLVLAVKDDITTTLILPEAYAYYWTGPLQYLFKSFPNIFDYRSLGFLQFIALGTKVFLILSVIGLFTRWSLIGAAVFYSLFYYVQIVYTHFYSSGFLPLTILYFLIFVPCGDGLSVDAWLKKKFGREKTLSNKLPDYGLAVFSCFAAYGLSYYVCALSKWRLDPYWASSNNMKKYLAGDSAALIDHVFNLNLTPYFVQMGGPDSFFLIAGTIALLSETAGILILFSNRARFIVPALLVCFHMGTFFFQKFIFPDLVVLALMFIPVELWLKSKPKVVQVDRTAFPVRTVLYCVLMAHIATSWIAGHKVFPLSNTWNMYASSGYAETTWYNFYYLNLKSGERIKTDLTDHIDFLGQAKWHSISYWPRDENPEELERMKQLFKNYAKVYNEGKSESDQIESMEFVHWTWDFVNDFASPDHGKVTKGLRYFIESGKLETF